MAVIKTYYNFIHFKFAFTLCINIFKTGYFSIKNVLALSSIFELINAFWKSLLCEGIWKKEGMQEGRIILVDSFTMESWKCKRTQEPSRNESSPVN